MSAIALPTIEQIERALCNPDKPGSLYRFFKLAWPAIEESELVAGWHMEEVCAHLEAVARGELDRLVINIPPGGTKSTMVSVVWQAWCWGAFGRPDLKFMFGSFDMDLSRRDALKAKGLILSEWYQRRWGMLANPSELEQHGIKQVSIAKANADRQDTAAIYWSTGGGYRFSTSVEGKATGWHCHIQGVDDPTNPNTIKGGGKQAIKQLDSDWAWYSGTMSTRKADPNWFARVIIMQRLHAADIAGRCIDEGYTALVLPMNYESSKRCVTKWGGDRRTVEGEILQPARFSAESIKTLRKDLGPINAAAQLDQNPAPEAGLIYQRDWFGLMFKFLPGKVQFVQSWDFTFKGTTDSDYVVGMQWAWGQGKFYLLDIVREKVGFLGGLALIRAFSKKWARVNRRILIEDKANGTAIMEVLDTEVPGVIGYSPSDSKEARANSTAGYYEAGDVLIHEDCPLQEQYITEHVQFPRGTNDDMVDAANQGILYMAGKLKTGSALSRAMANVGKVPGLGVGKS